MMSRQHTNIRIRFDCGAQNNTIPWTAALDSSEQISVLAVLGSDDIPVGKQNPSLEDLVCPVP